MSKRLCRKNYRNLLLVILPVLGLVFSGCGKKTPPDVSEQKKDVTEVVREKMGEPEIQKTVTVPQKAETPPVKKDDNAVAIKTDPSKTTATISGVIRYDGEIPKFKEIKMEADPICLTQHGEAVFPQTLVLGEDKTMGNVFIRIKSGLSKKEYPAPTAPVVLDQKGCMYEPHVFGVMVNQPIKILNPDGTLHNVHALPKVNDEFNLAMPKFRKETTKSFDKPEFMFPIKCDVHPWMMTWVSVMAHPYYDVTGSNGQYLIDDLPPGTYVVEYWHEKLGTKTQTATLAAGETAEINISFAR